MGVGGLVVVWVVFFGLSWNRCRLCGCEWACFGPLGPCIGVAGFTRECQPPCIGVAGFKCERRCPRSGPLVACAAGWGRLVVPALPWIQPRAVWCSN